ncbi:hypothetical protein PoB_007343500 [Plakobranchus ocellatus]|uniref:Uncharacterized protein n=1 Tax=Plakobranchus ocellatus TaxID=259542 RepID=A0AAV4DS05_9GAST|nr:hypothetical protein PoB_007343500 [Plakobranchus ocellatus]
MTAACAYNYLQRESRQLNGQKDNMHTRTKSSSAPKTTHVLGNINATRTKTRRRNFSDSRTLVIFPETRTPSLEIISDTCALEIFPETRTASLEIISDKHMGYLTSLTHTGMRSSITLTCARAIFDEMHKRAQDLR